MQFYKLEWETANHKYRLLWRGRIRTTIREQSKDRKMTVDYSWGKSEYTASKQNSEVKMERDG